jgi:hypothetical protein
MPKNRRIVITGIGPLASPGIGKDAFWEGITLNRTGLELENFTINNKSWGKFYLNKIKRFNINNFGIDKNSLSDLKAWKNGEETTDLFYLLACIKLAIDDSKLIYNKESNK